MEEIKYAEGDFLMIAKTLYGLEEVLVKELQKLGAKDIVEHNRAVSFVGDKGFMYKANFSLRTAIRILKPLKTFTVQNEESLYNEVKKMEWENYLTNKQTLLVDAVLNTEIFTHTQYISQKTKDAIVDRFREMTGDRPSVDLLNPDLRINVHIFRDQCTISLDSSGDSLHKRGYRQDTNLAPLNEVLAAGMILLTGWTPHFAFIDPMCGSGTIPIEAAMIANNIPAGFHRSYFAFKRWNDFDEALWKTIYDSSIGKIKNDNPEIIGIEISRNVVKKTKENIKSAMVEDVVKVVNADFTEFEPSARKGVVIMNPPYGERMIKDDIMELYKKIGDTFKKKYAGYDCWLITSNLEAIKQIGLRPSRKITLYNGTLECKFMKFEMYVGTKKIHKLVKENKE